MFCFCILVAQTDLVCYIAKNDLEPLILLYKLILLKAKSCWFFFLGKRHLHAQTPEKGLTRLASNS